MSRAFFLLLSTASLLAGAPWPGVPFTEVRAYAWPDDKHTEAVILPGMALKPGVINKDGALLSPEQTKRSLAAVTLKHPDHPVAACYLPHNAFVFYDAAKKPVAFVEVCFGCLSSRIQPRSSGHPFDLLVLASIFDAHKLPMGEYPNLAAFKKHFDDIINYKPPKTPKTKDGVRMIPGLEPLSK
jgi:hypothetical protein